MKFTETQLGVMLRLLEREVSHQREIYRAMQKHKSVTLEQLEGVLDDINAMTEVIKIIQKESA
jgi:hypothetical protein|tara:strand:- start:16358 stop:16546 length:189 start_codon:yes stop_codon:yes gene_type:complete